MNSKGWIKTKLGSVLSLEYGKSLPEAKRDNGDYPVYGSNGIVGGNSEFLVQGPGIVVGRKGSYGEITWSEKAFFPIDTTYYVVPTDSIDIRLAYYLLRSLDLKSLNRSTAIPGLNRNDAYDLDILLPSLPEQKRIVAKLDTLFAHLDQLRARLDKIPVLLKQFRQAVLTQAVTGKLTESDYSLRPLGEFSIEIQTGPFGSALHKEDYVVGGIPVINPSHIFDGEIVPDTSVTIRQAKSNELRAWLLNDGDIILGRRGEMGRAAKYKDTDGVMICGTGSLILRKTSLIDPDFMSFYLRSSFSMQFLEENAVGSTMVNLNQRVIKSLPFPSIPVEEQRKIVSKVQSLFALADRTEANYESTREKVNSFPQAVLSKAFRGDILNSQEARSEIYVEESGSSHFANEREFKGSLTMAAHVFCMIVEVISIKVAEK